MSTSSVFHLTHKVAWHDLASRFTFYRDPGIELPIGVCGRIHAHTRKTQLQLANRSYLSNHVCTSQDNCDEHNGTKVFRKSNKFKPVTLERTNQSQRSIAENATAYNRFIDSLSSAIREFAKTERNKVIQRKVMREDEQKKLIDKLRQKCKLDVTFVERSTCLCQVFCALIEVGDSTTLLSFSDDQIGSVLGCHHGCPVGNNIRSLWSNVIKVYVYTNMIALFGVQDNPQKWGPMSPDRYFRSCLNYDIGGQTFLYSSRSFLTNELFMKDWDVHELLPISPFRGNAQAGDGRGMDSGQTQR